MKKIFISILLFIFIFSIVYSQSFTELYTKFKVINSYHKISEMKNLLSELEKYTDDASLLALYCNALTEYANWGVSENQKENIYNKAVDIGKKAVKLDEKNGYAHYALGAAIGRLAQYKGIVSSLFMLGDFDEHIKKAIKLDPNLYTAYIALGMRYRDVPWPLYNYKKSEQYLLKAAEIEPSYVNAYYELGVLYKIWKKYDKAKEMFEKVINMPLHQDWIEQGKEAKEDAKKELESLK
ncbi:tetratricopeptide repeat protein [Marinitoga aeolica]|uniref:Tetratricopeptide repeat protein n=1 Tax=Marinitoga aeolica TaxID=2809031 RepID=A0ABY8PRP2_9BACT|nr:tetratricopeptide repeat protein [Marinitoga aeolica]WGS65298.1 tetratricopeptide repeat protein [Marinitoga aeolica]